MPILKRPLWRLPRPRACLPGRASPAPGWPGERRLS